jgi:hypothetical protein|tara:strand:- start:131 stop:310 length:180 start_codon:yes stop_codon:yes gene_type:complete
MAIIADKAWYKSKTVWTSVIAGVVGVAQAAGVIEAVPEVVWTLLAAFGLYGVRDAVGKA